MDDKRQPPRLWLPRYKIIEPRDPLICRIGVKGRFQLTALGPDGVTVCRHRPWFDNLITDQGMDALASSSGWGIARVGTDNTTPNVADTALGAEVANGSSVQATSRSTNPSSPYEMHSTVTYRLGPAGSNHNLAEVGIGSLFSHALIVDGVGSPTTFPWNTGEFLDIAYEFIVYPPLADSMDTVDGYDVVGRASGAGTSAWRMVQGGTFLASAHIPTVGATAYSGAIGAITGVPSGTLAGASSHANVSYTPGSFERGLSVSYGLDDGNVGGIAAATCRFGNSNPVSSSARTEINFQASYDPVIDKSNDDLLTLNYLLSWARV